MRKRLIIAVTFLGGVYFIVEFLLPEYFPSGFGPDGAWRGIRIREYHEEILTGLQAVGNGAIALGLVNIFRVFGVAVLKRRKGWPFSLTLVLAMLAMMAVTFWMWSQDLGTQHQVGPLGVQRDFQSRLLNYIGRPPPPDPQAAQRVERTRDAALLRYLADTRKSVSPPAVSTADAAAQLASLAAFLQGKAPAPAFFQVTDAPENPAEYGAPGDLLDQPKEPELQPLKTPDAAARLAELVKQRDGLAGTLLASSEVLKAQTTLDVAAVLTERAAASRALVPSLRQLAQDVRRLADAEHAVYKEPADFSLRYRGGAAPAPVPMFGRLYLFSRALAHSAVVLHGYANVLDRAALEIPQSKAHEQDLANWLDGRAESAGALRRSWLQHVTADVASALPAVTARLSVAGPPDPLRARMLEDLRNAGVLGAACDQALADLAAAHAALAGPGDLAAQTRAAAEAAARALAALRDQEAALRVLRVRSVEQDLSYLDLTPDDAAKIVTPALKEQAGAQGEAVARSAEVLQGIAAAAKQLAADLNGQCEQMQKDLDAAVAAVRKTWRDKTSIELKELRDGQDSRAREIAALRTRAIVAAEAEKMAVDAAAGAASPPELAALARLVAALPAAKTSADAVAAVAAARKAVADGELYAAQRAAKIVDRFITKHDMKDVRVLAAAGDSIRAWSGAVQSDALLSAAATDAVLSVQALAVSDLPAARKTMENCSREIAQAQEGAKEALQQIANRSAVTGLYKCFFDGLFVSLGAAMFSLLAFYIATAAYRAFRVKSAEALLMMVAALLVMLGQIPFGGYIWGRFPEVRLWVLQVFSTPAFRGIALGAAVASLAMAMRMWLSLETSAFYREEEEGGA